MNGVVIHMFVIIGISLFIYSMTMYGRNATNTVQPINVEFKSIVQKVSQDVEYNFKTNKLNEYEGVRTYFQTILQTHPYINKVFILTPHATSRVAFRDNNDILVNKLVYSEESFKKNYSEWYTKSLVDPVWSDPYYTNEDSDRSFVLHHTSNVLSVDSGKADAVINITCKSKLRKRSGVILTQ